MFGKKQNQMVNFNVLLEQVQENMEAQMMITRVRRYLTACVVEKQKRFYEEKKNKKADDTFYSWDYPFELFRDDISKIAEIIEYDMPYELQQKMEEDYVYAEAWNREVDALKEARKAEEEKKAAEADNGKNEP